MLQVSDFMDGVVKMGRYVADNMKVNDCVIGKYKAIPFVAPRYVMALDAGTTSNRCILFDKSGTVVSVAQKEFNQYFPEPG